MGCGASVAQNQHLKVVPSPSMPQNNSPSMPQNNSPSPPNTAKKDPTATVSNKTIEKSAQGMPNSTHNSRKEPLGRSPGKKSAEKEIRSSSIGKKQAGGSSSGAKLTDSAIIARSPSRQRDELRESSTSKTGKKGRGRQAKEEMRSSKSKLTNPQGETELRDSYPVSMIKEEGELRNTRSKKEVTHSIKKIKSVKNNKELADLIKIYAL